MRASEVEEWVDVLYALGALACALLIFVSQVFWIPPNALLLTAGGALLVGPEAVRRDRIRRRRREDANEGPGGYWEAP